MNNFIKIEDYDASIHREILDSLVRGNADGNATVEVCENRAIETIRSLIGKRYDCDKIFAAQNEQRNVLILKIAVDISVYEIYCQHNPYKMSQTRRDRYEDAMEFLREIRDYKENIEGLPLLPDESQASNTPWQIESNCLRATHY